MSENVNPAKYFASGGFGGICTVVVGHPMDTIKVRLQTMPPVGSHNGEPLYKGTLDCAKKTVSKEGFRGFYKGMSAPLAVIAPIFAMTFLGFGIGKKLQQNDPNEKLTIQQLFYAGAFSGVFTTLLVAPGERTKCLLQIQQGDAKPKYRGPIDCVKKLHAEGGLRSIFKGSCATLLRDAPGNGAYFATYEYLQREMQPKEGNLSLMSTIIAGGCAGVANWIVAMPADVLKSRLQTSPENKFNNVREVFLNLMRVEGPVALYKGVVPVMLRAFPANAACFTGFEMAKEFLDLLCPNAS